MSSPKFWCLLFLFAWTSAERPWKDWKAEQFYWFLGRFWYYPHQCCQLCGAGEEWRRTDFVDGRCIIGPSNYIGNWDSGAVPLGSQKVTERHDCCAYCGSKPGEFQFIQRKETDKFDGFCERVQKDYVLPNSDGSSAPYPHKKEVVNACHFCQTLVNAIYAKFTLNPDNLLRILVESCETYSDVFECKKIVNNNLDAINFYYRKRVTVQKVCSRFMSMCPDEPVKDHESLEMGKHFNRSTILDKFYDAPPLKFSALLNITSKDLMADRLLHFENSNTTIANLQGLKFLAKYSLIPNSHKCELCPGQDMHFIVAPKEFSMKNKEQFAFRCANCQDGSDGTGSDLLSARNSFLTHINGNLSQVIDAILLSASDPPRDREQIQQISGLEAMEINKVIQHVAYAQQNYIIHLKNASVIGGKNKYVEFYEARYIVKDVYKNSLSFDRNTAYFIVVDSESLNMHAGPIYRPQLPDVMSFLLHYVQPGSIIVNKNWTFYGDLTTSIRNYEEGKNQSFPFEFVTENNVLHAGPWRNWMRKTAETDLQPLQDPVFHTLFRRMTGEKSISTTFYALKEFA